MIKSKAATSFILLLIFASSLLLFYPSLNYYFFQDDWFVLNWVRTGDLKSFFEFRTDIIYWRPLSMPIFFLLGEKLFGLRPFGYHLIVFIIHLVNTFLIGRIIFLLFKNRLSVFTIALLYATASFHYMSLSWLSLAWNVIGNLFILLAIYFYIFGERKPKVYFPLSFIFFLLALASTEFAIVFPVLIIFVELFRNNFNLSKALKRGMILISASSLIVLIYLFIRFVLFPVPSDGEYAIAIDSRVFNNYFWYLAWLVNLPEVLKYQIQLTNLSAPKDPTFLEPFRPYTYPLLTSSFIFALTLGALFINISGRSKIKALIAALIFIAFALSPVIFLPFHSFPYYLTVASIGFLVFIGYIFSNIIKKSTSIINLLLTILIIVSWITTSFFNLAFTRKTHWIPGEQSISKENVDEVQNKLQNMGNINTVEIVNSDGQVKQSLMDQNALKVIYNSDDIKTIYK